MPNGTDPLARRTTASGTDPLVRRTASGADPLLLRTARRLRGWGGVAAMAVACGLTASLTLLPLAQDGDDAAAATRTPGPGVGTGVQIKADTCEHPEASSPPRRRTARRSGRSRTAGS